MPASIPSPGSSRRSPSRWATADSPTPKIFTVRTASGWRPPMRSSRGMTCSRHIRCISAGTPGISATTRPSRSAHNPGAEPMGPRSAELFAQGLRDLVRKALQALRALVGAHHQDHVMNALAEVARGNLQGCRVLAAHECLRADLNLAGVTTNCLAMAEQRVALLGEGCRIAGLVPAVGQLRDDPEAALQTLRPEPDRWSARREGWRIAYRIAERVRPRIDSHILGRTAP